MKTGGTETRMKEKAKKLVRPLVSAAVFGGLGLLISLASRAAGGT